MRYKVRKWAGNIAREWLEIPPGTFNNQSRIVILGMHQIILENFLELLSFSSEQIRIRHRDGVISIGGRGLTIRSIVTEELIVEGEILQLNFTLES